MHGNLVAVFPAQSSFADPIWTTVQSRGNVLPDGAMSANLTFSKEANSMNFLECFQTLAQNNGNFLLIESPAYYLSYWPVLKALQTLDPNELPFQEELVTGKCVEYNTYDVDFPDLSDVSEEDEVIAADEQAESDENFSAKADDDNEADNADGDNETDNADGDNETDTISNADGDNDIGEREQQRSGFQTENEDGELESQQESEVKRDTLPDNSVNVFKKLTQRGIIPGNIFGGIILDSSQMKAMRVLIENRVAVIQGPPGTGKTLLGVKAVERLLKMDKIDGDPLIEGPILILTYKNHALDEFSKHIVKRRSLKPNEFIRIGGQSKDETMRRYSLQSALKRASVLEFQLKNSLEEVSQKLLNDFEEFKASSSKLDLDVLKKHLSLAQIAILIKTFADRNPGYDQIVFENMKFRFDGLDNMALRLHELLNERSFEAGIEELERLFTAAIHNWLPEKDFVSNLIEIEKRKQIMQQNTSFKKVTDSITEEELTEAEVSQIIDDLQLLADERRDESADEKEENHVIKKEFTIQDVQDEDELCLRHFGILTKLFASRVNLDDFKLNSCLFDLSPLERFQFLQAMLVKQCEVASASLRTSFGQYEALALQVRKGTLSREVEVLKQAEVVAMTITGAAIRNEVLNTVKPPVIIVEEAAEISEAHLLALLGSHVQQLILIGDHKQLRPQVECYNLVKKYHFDISMMERLINNKLPFATLAYQNRMRPDISKYLKDIYPELKDSERVLQNPEVEGLQKNFYFWNHQNYETKGRSPVNPIEAEAAISLAKYLCEFNGYCYDQITILTGYKGQTAHIRQLAKNVKTGEKRLDVQTIDNFQGDENDIVIVSTTRNNSEKNPGFMGVLNRRCVAQSRGKSGVYFLGNAETLQSTKKDGKTSSVWFPFFQELQTDDAFGEELVLECKNHKEVLKKLKVGETFPTKRFCKENCTIAMPCGIHPCPLKCQPYHPSEHSRCEKKVDFDFKCGKHSSVKKCYVDKNQLICNNNCDYKFHQNSASGSHQCTRKCEPEHDHEKCCSVVDFFCEKNEHPLERKCWQNPESISCNFKVTFVFAFCGVHTGEAFCYEDEKTKVCQNRCLKLMSPCGHACQKFCEPEHDHDSVEVSCRVTVTYTCANCGGAKMRFCFQQDADIHCKLSVRFQFPKCERHTGFRKCYENPNDLICPNRCDLPLPNCGHLCKKPCRDEHLHDPENNTCEKLIQFRHRCGMILTRSCWQPEDSVNCTERCIGILNCKHRCPLNCSPSHNHEDNPAIVCREQVQAMCENCGSGLLKLCFEELDSSKCCAEVKFKHSCGFELSRPCNKSEQDVKCTGQCAEMLSCGHRCAKECAAEHNHDYECIEWVDFACRSCSKSLKRKCNDNEDGIKCTGQMKRFCDSCNAESAGPCNRSDLEFECHLPCVKKLKCGHTCSQKCFETCSDAKCKPCLEEQKAKERIERQRRENQKNEEILQKRTEIKQQILSMPPHCPKEVNEYKIKPNGEDSARFFELTDMVMKYLKVQKGHVARINSVSTVKNKLGQKDITMAQWNLIDPTNKKSLCYFTPDGYRQVKNLVHNGLFSRFSNRGHSFHRKPSNEYIEFSIESPEVRFKSRNFGFTVLVCDVLVGRAKTVESPMDVPKTWNEMDKRFDSVLLRASSSESTSSHIIYKSSHILVTDRVEFSLEQIKTSSDHGLKNGTFQKIKLEPQRNFLMKDEKQEYCRMALSQFYQGCTNQGRSIKSISSIHLFFNPDLEKNFERKESEFKEKYTNPKYHEQIIAFHGTSYPDPDQIMKDNFSLDKIKRTAHGYGIYFSEYVSTSMIYTGNTGQLILARVLLGKSEVASKCEKMKDGCRNICEDHDSHTVEPSEQGHSNMVIIQNVDQILPMFIIRTK